MTYDSRVRKRRSSAKFHRSCPASARCFQQFILAMAVSGTAAACQHTGNDSDDPSNGVDGSSDAQESCIELFQQILEDHTCPPPMSPRLGGFGSDSVIWLDEPAFEPNGVDLGDIGTADWIGYRLTDREDCQIACVIQYGQPCYQASNRICLGLDEERNPKCLYCGKATMEECAEFMNTCSVD